MPPFKARERKHKVLRRTQGNSHGNGVGNDTNATEILPASQKEREAKALALKEQLRAQQPKMSGKKQKRLDKYIVTSRGVLLHGSSGLLTGSLGDQIKKGRESRVAEEACRDEN